MLSEHTFLSKYVRMIFTRLWTIVLAVSELIRKLEIVIVKSSKLTKLRDTIISTIVELHVYKRISKFVLLIINQGPQKSYASKMYKEGKESKTTHNMVSFQRKMMIVDSVIVSRLQLYITS